MRLGVYRKHLTSSNVQIARKWSIGPVAVITSYAFVNTNFVTFVDKNGNQVIIRSIIKAMLNATDRYQSYNPDRYQSYNPDRYQSYNPDRYQSYNLNRYQSYNPDRYHPLHVFQTVLDNIFFNKI